ncbi:perforin-1-like [Diretmus argenteus]
MARLWPLMLLCWAWSPLCLSSSVRNESFLGTPKQCARAPFVPGHNLGGEGIDIVTMEQKNAYIIDTDKWKRKDGTCTLLKNPHLNEVEKIPVAVVDWRAVQNCNSRVSGTIYDSSESLVHEATSAVSNNWKIGLSLPMRNRVTFEGSHSKEALFATKRSKQDLYTFLRHSAKCNFYRYRMASKPPLTKEFLHSIQDLPPVYTVKTKQEYQNVINTYGTHYIDKVHLGGKMTAITAIRTCMVTLSGLTQTEVKNCLAVEASAVSKVRFDAMFRYCQRKKKKMGTHQSFSSKFNDRITRVIGGNINRADLFKTKPNSAWIKSLKRMPGLVRYSLKPLHTILPPGHHARAGLKKEIRNYIIAKSLKQKCSESCLIGRRSSARDRCVCVCHSNRYIKSNCCPARKGIARLKVFNLYARGLYGDVFSKTDGSVMVRYGQLVGRTAVIQNNDNPRWREVFNFGTITIGRRTRLNFKVYDEDRKWNSDLLGSCSFKLYRGARRGTCMFKYGTFYFSYNVRCEPSLGGRQCADYIPSPMSSSLAEVFYSRNGVLGGQSRLQWAQSNNQSGFHLPDVDLKE